MKFNKLLLITILGIVTTNMKAQTKADRFFGTLENAEKVVCEYDRLYKRIKKHYSDFTTDNGAVVKVTSGGTSICKIDWQNLQIEKMGPYLYFYRIIGKKYKILGRHPLTVNDTVTYKQGKYSILIIILGKRADIYLKQDLKTIEVYCIK